MDYHYMTWADSRCAIRGKKVLGLEEGSVSKQRQKKETKCTGRLMS